MFPKINKMYSSRNDAPLQLDIPLAGAKFGTIPQNMPGRINVDDYVFFTLPCNMRACDYDVLVESMDTSSPNHWRNLGPLAQVSVRLPFVHFPSEALISVTPHADPHLPSYIARLNRGSTYTITVLPTRGAVGRKLAMQRSGILTAASSGW
jgi:hypothetical protein